MFGSQLDLLHAKVVFNAGAEFKTPIPPDLLAGIQKVGDNIMSTARSIAERIIGYLRVARNWVLDLHGRVSDYVSPVTGLLADAEVMLTGIIDTLDVSAVAKRFLDAATAAVNNLPIITFFRDSILTAVDQVGAMVADGAMSALVNFLPKVQALQDKVLPVVTKVSTTISDVATVVTSADEMLSLILAPAEKLVLVADALDKVDVLLGALVGEETTVTDATAAASAVGDLVSGFGGDEVAVYVNMTQQASVLWEKASALVELLGFKGIEDLAGDPVQAMRTAVTQFLERGMSGLQERALAVLTERLSDLAEGTGDNAVAVIQDLVSGGGMADLESLALTAVDDVVAAATGRLQGLGGTLSAALESLDAAAPVAALETFIGDALAELTGPTGLIAKLETAARAAIDNGLDAGSAIDHVRGLVVQAVRDAIEAVSSGAEGDAFSAFVGQVTASVPRHVDAARRAVSGLVSDALADARAGLQAVEPVLDAVMRDGEALWADLAAGVEARMETTAASLVGPSLDRLIALLDGRLRTSALASLVSSTLSDIAQALSEVDGPSMRAVGAMSHLQLGRTAQRTMDTLQSHFDDLNAAFIAIQATFLSFEHEAVRFYNSIVDDEDVDAAVLDVAEAVAEVAGQLAFSLSNAGAAITDLPETSIQALMDLCVEMHGLLPAYRSHVAPLSVSLVDADAAANALETIFVHAAVARATLAAGAALQVLADEFAAAVAADQPYSATASVHAAVDSILAMETSLGAALDEHVVRVESRYAAARAATSSATPQSALAVVAAASGRVAAQVAPLLDTAVTAADRATARHVLRTVHELGSAAARAASVVLVQPPQGSPPSVGPTVRPISGEAVWPTSAAFAVAEAARATAATGALPAFLRGSMADGGASLDELQAAIADLGFAGTPAPVLASLADLVDVSGQAARAAALVDNVLPALGTAVSGGVPDVGELRSAAASIAAVVEPFSDAAGRQVRAVEAELAAAAPGSTGFGVLTQAVATMLADGSTTDATNPLFIYWSDREQLVEIQAAVDAVRYGYGNLTALASPAVTSVADAQALVAAVDRAITALKNVNVTVHEQLCEEIVLNMYNETKFEVDDATGETKLVWRMVANTTQRCAAYVHLPTQLGSPALREAIDILLPRAALLARRVAALPGMGRIHRLCRLAKDVAAVAGVLSRLPSMVVDLLDTVQNITASTGDVVRRVQAAVASGVGRLGPQLNQQLAGGVDALRVAAVAVAGANPPDSQLAQDAREVASWSAALRDLLLKLPASPASWSIEQWVEVAKAGSDLGAALQKVSSSIGQDATLQSAADLVARTLHQLGLGGGATGAAASSTVHLLYGLDQTAQHLGRWVGMYKDVVDVVSAGSGAATRRRRLFNVNAFKDKVVAKLYKLRDRVLTDKLACTLAPVAAIGLAVADEVSGRVGSNTGSFSAVTQALFSSLDAELQAFAANLTTAPGRTLAGLGSGVLRRMKASITTINDTLTSAGPDLDKAVPAHTLATFRRKLAQLDLVVSEALHADRLQKLLVLDRLVSFVRTLVDGIHAVPPTANVFEAVPAVVRPAVASASYALAQEVARHVQSTNASDALNTLLASRATEAADALGPVLDLLHTPGAGASPTAAAAVLRTRLALEWVAAASARGGDFDWDFDPTGAGPAHPDADPIAYDWSGVVPLPVLERMHAVAAVADALAMLRRMAGAEDASEELTGDDSAVASTSTAAAAAQQALALPQVTAVADVVALTSLHGVDADFLQMLSDLWLAADLASAAVPMTALHLNVPPAEVLTSSVGAVQSALTGTQAAIHRHRSRAASLDVAVRSTGFSAVVAAAQDGSPELAELQAAVDDLPTHVTMPAAAPQDVHAASQWAGEIPKGKSQAALTALHRVRDALASLSMSQAGTLPAASARSFGRAVALAARQLRVRVFSVQATTLLWTLETLVSVVDLHAAVQGVLPTPGTPALPSEVLDALSPALVAVVDTHLGGQFHFAIANYTGASFTVAVAGAMLARVEAVVAAAGGLAALPVDDQALVSSLTSALGDLTNAHRLVVAAQANGGGHPASAVAYAVAKLAVHDAMAAVEGGELLLPGLSDALRGVAGAQNFAVPAVSWEWDCLADSLASSLPNVAIRGALRVFATAMETVERVVRAGENIASDLGEVDAEINAVGFVRALPRFVGVSIPRIGGNITYALTPPLEEPLLTLLQRIDANLATLAPELPRLAAVERLAGFGDMPSSVAVLRNELGSLAREDLDTLGGASVDALVSALRSVGDAYRAVPLSDRDVAALSVPISFTGLADDLDAARSAVWAKGKLLSEETPPVGGIQDRLAAVPTATVLDALELRTAAACCRP